MSGNSSLATYFYVFVGLVVVLAVFAPFLISVVTNLFIYFLVDHIEGLIVGALLASIIGKRLEAGIVGAIAGVILQYWLFH